MSNDFSIIKCEGCGQPVQFWETRLTDDGVRLCRPCYKECHASTMDDSHEGD